MSPSKKQHRTMSAKHLSPPLAQQAQVLKIMN
jgi:hypothetical protein